MQPIHHVQGEVARRLFMGFTCAPGTTRTTAALSEKGELTPVLEVPAFLLEEVVRIKDVRRAPKKSPPGQRQRQLT